MPKIYEHATCWEMVVGKYLTVFVFVIKPLCYVSADNCEQQSTAVCPVAWSPHWDTSNSREGFACMACAVQSTHAVCSELQGHHKMQGGHVLPEAPALVTVWFLISLWPLHAQKPLMVDKSLQFTSLASPFGVTTQFRSWSHNSVSRVSSYIWRVQDPGLFLLPRYIYKIQICMHCIGKGELHLSPETWRPLFMQCCACLKFR